MHEDIYPELQDPLQAMKVLKPSETALKFLKTFAKGRFEQPISDQPVHHVSEFVQESLIKKEQESRRQKKKNSAGRIEL